MTINHSSVELAAYSLFLVRYNRILKEFGGDRAWPLPELLASQIMLFVRDYFQSSQSKKPIGAFVYSEGGRGPRTSFF